MAALLSGLGLVPTPTTVSPLVGQDPVNLGPLTTTFTQPPACTVAVADGKDPSAWLAQSCDGLKGAVDVTTCWPPTSKGAPSTTDALHGWGYYSPGIACPAGHASACSATGGASGGSGWPVQFKLLDGETAVGCCPRYGMFGGPLNFFFFFSNWRERVTDPKRVVASPAPI